MSQKRDASDRPDAGETATGLLTFAAEEHTGSKRELSLLNIGSDTEIASRVAADIWRRFGQFIYCGDFWRYGQTHWEPIQLETVWQMIIRYDGALSKSPNGARSLIKLNQARIESIIVCLRHKVTSQDFFATPAVGINCASGFIRFDASGSPALIAHSPDHRHRHTLIGRWPTEVTDEQRGESLLHRLLSGCFGADDDAAAKIDLLAEVAGVAALGMGTSVSKPKALILVGPLAENGKSQLTEALRGLLPQQAVASISPTRFNDRTFTCQLPGKLLNAADELGSADAIASDVFKQIITGDPTSSRDLYKSAFEFRPQAQHVFAANSLPTFKGGMDRGVRRRVMLLICNRVIPVHERIDHIGRRVGEQEADLLLEFAVRGASRVIANRAFTEPPSSIEALRDWTISADPVVGWLASDGVEFSRNAYVPETRTNAAHRDFQSWALNEGYAREKLPAINGFTQRVIAAAGDRGVTKKRTAEGPFFVGLCSIPGGRGG